jgi:uncharacterized RmlC-like cupin family protein
MCSNSPDWRERGVRIVRHDQLDPCTAQTPGMYREAAISRASAGAEKIWAGTVTIQPGTQTGPHHHGKLESVIYVLHGRARMRWGDRLEFTSESGPRRLHLRPPRRCRTRRSTSALTSRCAASSSAATRNPSW